MFYSQFILAKKGPLGTIWIAAHLERKLRKNQITETNISASVDSILFPEVPIALRLSGHLLLGVVRIYSRKVNYLFHDCSEALIKIKHAFHSSAVDLPPESSTAPFHSITLPETFDFDELEVFLKRDKGIPAAVRGIVDHNVSERDLITLREQDAQACRSSLFTLDERFPENCDPYSLLDYHDEQHVRDELQNCTGSASASLMQENCGPSLEEDVLPPLQMDDEMDFEKTNIDEAAVFQEMVLDEVATPLMHTNLQDTLIPEPGAEQLHSPSKDAHVANGSMSVTEMLQILDVERLRSVVEPQEHEPFFMELDDELGHKNDAVDLAEHKEGNAADDLGTHVEEPTPVLKETPVSSRPSPLTAETYTDFHGSDDLLATILGGRTPALKMIGTPSEVVASVKEKRGQRKRKHVLDDSVALSSMIMKKQLTDTADLCRKRRRTPLTKFQARKMQGSYNDEKFAIPSFPGLCIDIKELYSSVVSLSSSKPVVKPSPHKLGNAKACEGFQEEAFSEAAEPNDLYNGMMENNATPEPLRADFQEVLQAAEPFPNATLSDGLFEQASENLTFLADSNETLQAAAEPLPNSASSEDLSEQALKNQTFLGDSEDRDSQEKALGAAERLPKTASAEDLSEQGLETATFPAGSKDALQAAEPLPNAASSEDVCEQALENLTFLADSKDKVFLAADEEANLEETDVNYHRKGKTVQDKSGWSLRTKAVAEYLKPLFEKLESTPVLDAGPSKLSLDSLLKRRSRKEAARMFFEILVLKSKEYIHVDQSTGFADIMLSSTHLLRKEVF